MITLHATTQLSRLDKIGYTIKPGLLDAIGNAYPNTKHYIRIARFARIYTIDDGIDYSVGDSVVIILNSGNIVTIMLASSNKNWTDGTNVDLTRD